MKEICKISGISRKTYYKWYGLEHGTKLRFYRQRKMHPHTKLTPSVKMIIYKNKIKYNYGPKKTRMFLENNHNIKMTANVICRYYKQRHLIRKPVKKQPWYTPLKEPYLAQTPGENAQIDIKYVPGKDLTWSYQYRFINAVTNMQFTTEAKSKDA